MEQTKSASTQLVLVTGPSGAGRSTAINVLEDLGYEAIDNLPLRLIPRVLDGPEPGRPIALGIDARNRDFSTSALIDVIGRLENIQATNLSVLYLDCHPEVLLRRFSETRRRHPLAPTESPEIGIRRELDLLERVRHRADMLVETTELNVHQLRTEIERWFTPREGKALALSVHSFSYKRGLPRGVDMVFDCRFLANPHWQPDLRGLDGRTAQVADYIAEDTRFAPFFNHVLELTRFLLPAYVDEGKSHLTIAFGCTGGQHRSVALTQALAKALDQDGHQVSVRHRELERRRTDDERPI